MQLARLAGLVVGIWLVAIVVRPAEACGSWAMTDNENQLAIGWLINSGAISTVKGGKRVAALYLDLEAKGGIRVVTAKRVIYDVKDGKLRKYGRPIGSIDASGNIVLGKQTFTVEFSDQREAHDMPQWTLTVRRGNDVIIESTTATALCAAMHRGGEMPLADQQGEIRRRVAFYLAWREVGL